MVKRSNISLLPGRHQTDTLKRFFASTVDQVLQPGSAETISGFIGRLPPYYDPKKDFYKAEPSLLRTTYQLEPAMASIASDGSITAALFYDDLLRQLATEGANVDNADRLLETDSWSWAPPIDIDKLTNFKQYYWIESAAPKVRLTAPRLSYTANSSATIFAVPSAITGIASSLDDVRAFIDDVETIAFTLVGDNIVFTTAPVAGTTVTVFRYSDLATTITSQPDFPIESFGITQEQFTSTVRVGLDDATSFSVGYSDPDYRGDTWFAALPAYFFDGKGDNPSFTLDEGDKTPFYVCCDRRSKDRSPWARNNRWVHRDTILDTGLATSDRQAKRPIVEFISNVQLWNYGFNRLPDITGVITGLPFDNVALVDIPLTSVTGRPAGTVEIDGGHVMVAGDRILVRSTNTINVVSVSGGLYVFDGTPTPVYGDIVRLVERGIVPYDETSYEVEPYEYNENALEFYYDGMEWVEAQAFSSQPLFELYDEDAILLSDPGIYPTSNFSGSRIFGYAPGTSADAILGLNVQFDKFGQFVFENDISSRVYSYRDGDITGYYYYCTNADSDPVYNNTWNASLTPIVAPLRNGLPEIPANLQANPDFEEPDFISRNQWFDHFSSIIANQENFEGQPFSVSNWRDTKRELHLGTSILQHRAPLLKTMLLASDATFSVVDGIRFMQTEYIRFRNKFVQTILDLSSEGSFNDTIAPPNWVEAALRRLSNSKSAEFAFSLSTMAGGQWFIPPTPSALGLYACTRPSMVVDSSFGAPVTFLQGHDGSMTPTFGDFRDNIMLSLENRIYDAISAKFRTGSPAFKLRDFTRGKFQEDSQYSYGFNEFSAIEIPMFENWARLNNLDFRDNSAFDASDYFTWNFSSSVDFTGASVPGNWRAIYRWYFDTERPHTAPWEMLGFSSIPAWWTSTYGPAPYLRSNALMWGHIESGYVAAPTPYTISERARPGLMNVLPVDDAGNLIDPYTARIITSLPTIQDASRSWMAGDGSPIEALWRRSASYPFDIMVASYLMKPVRFVEDGWDADDRLFVIGDQWVNASARRRLRHAELFIHGEFVDNAYVIKNGVQQFVIEAMASRGQSASIVGNAVRGLAPRIAHKMAGYTTASGLRLATENFGLIPQEDAAVRLYRSPAQRSEFYSGVVIEKQDSGYRILGYDQQNPVFKVLPPLTNSNSVYLSNSTPPPAVNRWNPNTRYTSTSYVEYASSIYRSNTAHTSSSVFDAKLWDAAPDVQRLIDNYNNGVNKYSKYADSPISIPYGSILATNQEVANLMLGHAAYMESRGWVFGNIDDSMATPDWSSSVLDFLAWSETNWAVGNFIALSPLADRALFKSDHGLVLEIDQKHGLVDKVGRPIIHRDVQIDRMDGEVSIAGKGVLLFGIRVRLAEIEHIILLSNTTIFNDVIYQPLYNLRQSRIKMSAMRTMDWNGRLEAPGYILSGNDLLPNFDRATENIRTMFDIERAGDATLRDHARHLIGYQSREYLTELGLPETQQFELYQGMIQSKGTIGSFDKLLRSDTLLRDTVPKVLEEWAFRIGSFGALAKRGSLAFRLHFSDVRRRPQFINFRPGPVVRDDWIQFSPGDDRWVEQPSVLFNLLPATTPMAALSLPMSAYTKPVEIEHTVFNFSGVSDSITAGIEFEAGETILVHDTGLGDWTTYVLRNATPTADVNRIIRIETSADDVAILGTRLVMQSPHGLTSDAIGMPILINGNFSIAPDISGVQIVTVITGDTIEIDNLVEEGFDFDAADTDGPLVLQFVRTRFADTIARDLAMTSIQPNEIAYVDDAGQGMWATFTRSATGWTNGRRQPRRVDTASIASSVIYNLDTAITTSRISPFPILLDRISIIDPSVGLISGTADRELDYKLEYDPAVYDLTAPWKDNRVGRLWWDLSTVRFTNCHTDDVFDLPTSDARYLSEMEHRIAHWGQIAPATSVDVYEWTRSKFSPSDWILAGKSDTTTKYQGVPYRGEDAPFFEDITIDPETGLAESIFYFWVKSRNSTPNIYGRLLDANSVERAITNPSGEDIPWLVPLGPNSLLVSGMESYINDTGSTLRIETTLTDYEGKDHSQWMLMRPTDEQSLPPRSLWNKLGSSLVGFNSTLHSVPDPFLHISEANGVGDTPVQSMFATRDSMLAARKSFVTMVNYILGRSNLSNTRASAVAALYRETPLPTRLTWTQSDGSNLIEPIPPRLEWDRRRAYTSEERDQILLGDDFIFALGAVPFDNPEGYEFFTYDFDDRLLASRPRILLDLTASARPQWSVWEINPDSASPVSIEDMLSRPNDFLIPALTYDRDVSSMTERDALITSILDPITTGDRVLVRGTTDTNGFWTIWKYEPTATQDNSGFVLVNAQTYRTSDFFNLADWYADGYDAATGPAVQYDTITDFRNGENPPVNSFVMVGDNGSGLWQWLVRDGVNWNVVAQENGTVQLSAIFYDPTRVVYGWGDEQTFVDISQISNRDGSLELRMLFDLLRDSGALTDLEINELWFSMIHHILSTQDQVDWAAKTSFLSLGGYNEPLLASPVSSPDNTAALLSYFEEVKPYRVKIRDSIRRLAPDIDSANVSGIELERSFDIDIVFDRVSATGLSDATLAQAMDITDIEIVLVERSGYALPTPTPDFAPVIFVEGERITYTTITIDGDYTRLGGLTRAPVTMFHEQGSPIFVGDLDLLSAATRILAFYQPTPGMIDKSLEELLNLQFKGTIVDGGTMNALISNFDLGGFDEQLYGDDQSIAYDANVIGSDGTAPLSMNPTVNGVPSYRLADPYHSADRPPELASLHGSDSLTITVTEDWVAGAIPQEIINVNTVRRRSPTTTLNFATIPQSKYGVVVFRDGLRAAPSEITVSLTGVVVSLVKTGGRRVSNVVVHVFGSASASRIRSRTLSAAGLASIAVPNTVGGVIEVIVDGDTPAIAPMISSEIVTVSPAPTSYSMVTVHDQGPYQTPAQSMFTDMLNWNVGQTWTLTHPASGNAYPVHWATHVEVNGLRLTPPTTIAVSTPVRYVMFERPITTAASVEVYESGDTPNPDVPVIGAWATLEDALAASVPGSRYGIFDKYVVCLNGESFPYDSKVTVKQFADYTVSPDGVNLAIIKPLVDGDQILVTTTTNAILSRLCTEVFIGSTIGQYPVPECDDPSKIWMTVDGVRLNYGQKFDVTDDVISSDGHLTSQSIVISYMKAPPTRVPSIRQTSTSFPDMSRYVGSGSNFKQIESAWETATVDYDRHSGRLTSPLFVDEISMTIDVSTTAPSLIRSEAIFPPPDAARNNPGVVWIDHERIEYYKMTQVGNIVTLSELRRGTRGTSGGLVHREAAIVISPIVE